MPKCISGDKSYTCTLDSASKKKAREELNEIESDRARAVQTFRSWVLEQRAWLKSPTGMIRTLLWHRSMSIRSFRIELHIVVIVTLKFACKC